MESPNAYDSRGVVEWVRRNFFSDIKDEKNIYEVMVESARSIPPGAGGIVVILLLCLLALPNLTTLKVLFWDWN